MLTKVDMSPLHPWEDTMRTTATMRRFVMAMPLALFGVPASAQLKPNHPMIETTQLPNERFVDAVNKGDGAAAAAIFTSAGFNMSVYGKNSGAKLVEEVQKVHDMGGTLTMKPHDIESLDGGRVLIVTGTFAVNYTNNPTTTMAEGNFTRVLVKEGLDWKIAAQNITPVRSEGGQ